MFIKTATSLEDQYLGQLHTLYKNEWWSKDRTLEDIKTMLHNTDFVFYALDEERGEMLGFARVLTDHKYFALIFDVIVKQDQRGQGLGKELLKAVINHPIISEIEYLELCCQEKYLEFYKSLGFTPGRGTRMQIKKVG
ncbi:MAG: GNAT family N-acetyltransferase [bacterium]|nr:GNAT family N-acetyltransferase [bacterium]